MRICAAVLASLAFSATAIAQAPAPSAAPRPSPAPALLVLSSPAYADGAPIPEKYSAPAGQHNAGISPPLSWKNAPAGTQSFVLMMRDEEYAPGRTFGPAYHWIIFNIPASATGLPEGVPIQKHLPDGSIQPSGVRGGGYAGMGAPHGRPHHYTMSLYALDTKLALGPDATVDEIGAAMNGHVLDKAFLVGLYHRPK